MIPVPDEKWGEVPVAFVALRRGARSADELRARAPRSRTSSPDRFDFSELPKTATGKIQKFALKKRLAAHSASTDGAS